MSHKRCRVISNVGARSRPMSARNSSRTRRPCNSAMSPASDSTTCSNTCAKHGGGPHPCGHVGYHHTMLAVIAYQSFCFSASRWSRARKPSVAMSYSPWQQTRHSYRFNMMLAARGACPSACLSARLVYRARPRPRMPERTRRCNMYFFCVIISWVLTCQSPQHICFNMLVATAYLF